MAIHRQSLIYKREKAMISYSDRMSLDSLENGSNDENGRLFFNNAGLTDLTNVNIVGNFVDTVRQLYYGTPEPELLIHLETLCKARENITNSILSGVWHLSHMGKASRYRFKVQNNDIGIVILYGSYFTRVEDDGQHLKIELSPKYIASNSPEEIQTYLDIIADYFLKTYQAKGCTVHLACDVQGWEPPKDFIENFTTYSRTIKSYDGLASLDLSDLNMSAATYGGKSAIKNYTIGRASALQFCIYDKTVEMKMSDKVDFYHQEWGTFSMGTYVPLEPVKRIEARIHHKIMREIGTGMEKDLESFLAVSEHLTDIWRYALIRNRLDLNKTTIDPFWQLILEDAEFYCPADGLHIQRKKKNDVTAVGRNFTAIIGNLISVMARNRDHTHLDVIRQLKQLSCYDDMLSYYRTRNITPADLVDLVRQTLALRRLTGKAG